MRLGGLIAVWAALALLPLACAGDDEKPTATTATPPTVETSTETTSTGATEQPPATTTEPAAEDVTADPALIAEAADKTAAARSARIATSVRISDPGRGQARFSGNGAFDFEQRSGELTLRLLEGEEGAFGESKAIFVDSSVYYQFPAGALAGGKRWIRLDLQDVADATSVDFGPLVQGSQADPSQYLLWLNALGPGVTKIGEEEVRGVPTTRYRAAVDLSLLENQAPPGKEAEWSAYVQTLRDRLGLEFIPVEVWVDGDGLIRRLYHEYGFTAEGASAIVTTELYDFGVQVDAKAPPPGQVAAIGDLIRP